LLSEAAKKRGVSAACQEAKVKTLKGRKLTPEHKEKLRLRQRGKVFTEEHRRNISISAKKRGMDAARAGLAAKRAREKGEST